MVERDVKVYSLQIEKVELFIEGTRLKFSKIPVLDIIRIPDKNRLKELQMNLAIQAWQNIIS